MRGGGMPPKKSAHYDQSTKTPEKSPNRARAMSEFNGSQDRDEFNKKVNGNLTALKISEVLSENDDFVETVSSKQFTP